MTNSELKEKLAKITKVISRKELGLESISNAKDLTEKIYKSNGNCLLENPVAYVLDKKNVLVIDILSFMENDSSKDYLVALLKILAENPLIEAIALSFDVWFVETDKENGRKITSVHDHPDRAEGISVQAEWRYADDYMKLGKVSRGKNGEILEIKDVISGPLSSQSRFSNLFIPLPKPGEFFN